MQAGQPEFNPQSPPRKKRIVSWHLYNMYIYAFTCKHTGINSIIPHPIEEKRSSVFNGNHDTQTVSGKNWVALSLSLFSRMQTKSGQAMLRTNVPQRRVFAILSPEMMVILHFQ